LKEGQTAVVLGGGPIGLLVALVARSKGAKVIISEVNPARIRLAEELAFSVVNPIETDLITFVKEATEGRLADVIFEVAGVQQTLDVMTKIAGIRSKIVMVAIHGQAKNINLFDFFWKELKLLGARVYEPEDYEESIALVTKNEIPFEKLITAVEPLTSIQQVFEAIDKNPSGMKVLLDCQL